MSKEQDKFSLHDAEALVNNVVEKLRARPATKIHIGPYRLAHPQMTVLVADAEWENPLTACPSRFRARTAIDFHEVKQLKDDRRKLEDILVVQAITDCYRAYAG